MCRLWYGNYLIHALHIAFNFRIMLLKFVWFLMGKLYLFYFFGLHLRE